jgi:DNA-binding transcriptional regulator of glucitol operon
MSLKAIHIVFVVAATLMCLGVGVWSLRGYAASGQLGELTLGVLSLLGAVVLVYYGKYVLKKLKHISYL